MPPTPRSFLLTDLSWLQVEEHLTRDSRLIVPIGNCDQFGPHLPLGAGTLVTEAVATELAREFAVLRAPTVNYGVNLPAPRGYPGAAGLHEKSLHRVLNDLLASWEDHGFREFILITAHRYDPHVDTIATVTSTRARVRVVELLGIDVSQFLRGAGVPEHGGEALTSLLLHLYPDRVDLARAVDFRPPARRRGPMRRISRLPVESPGSVGEPLMASAETGRQIYEHIVQKVRTKVFVAPEEEEV